MKEVINDKGLSVYEFEDSEISDKFYIAIAKVSAERYVIDRSIDNVSANLC